jgi:alkanesulfonate monooxygenase SsuD/methylene tetrahydromethanopterin reductase-like flavin-dependent oxidoreductase (luciferase family)
MTQPLRLGWKASAEQFGPRPLLDFAVLAEELGFDSVMVSDHFTHAQTPRAAHFFEVPPPCGEGHAGGR